MKTISFIKSLLFRVSSAFLAAFATFVLLLGVVALTISKQNPELSIDKVPNSQLEIVAWLFFLFLGIYLILFVPPVFKKLKRS